MSLAIQYIQIVFYLSTLTLSRELTRLTTRSTSNSVNNKSWYLCPLPETSASPYSRIWYHLYTAHINTVVTWIQSILPSHKGLQVLFSSLTSFRFRYTTHLTCMGWLPAIEWSRNSLQLPIVSWWSQSDREVTLTDLLRIHVIRYTVIFPSSGEYKRAC